MTSPLPNLGGTYFAIGREEYIFMIRKRLMALAFLACAPLAACGTLPPLEEEITPRVGYSQAQAQNGDTITYRYVSGGGSTEAGLNFLEREQCRPQGGYHTSGGIAEACRTEILVAGEWKPREQVRTEAMTQVASAAIGATGQVLSGAFAPGVKINMSSDSNSEADAVAQQQQGQEQQAYGGKGVGYGGEGGKAIVKVDHKPGDQGGGGDPPPCHHGCPPEGNGLF